MTAATLPVWRSLLFVPVTARRFVDGAARRGADAIILDLEDSVAASEKERARTPDTRNPDQVHALESLRLARTELERQLAATSHERRRSQLGQAIEEIDRRNHVHAMKFLST